MTRRQLVDVGGDPGLGAALGGRTIRWPVVGASPRVREAGVIRQRQEATLRMTSLRREDLDARFPGLLDRILEAAEEEASIAA
jgi:hypothetical protein